MLPLEHRLLVDEAAVGLVEIAKAVAVLLTGRKTAVKLVEASVGSCEFRGVLLC